MRVVLFENVKRLGQKYEMKEVADGYARNFLIPRGLAKPATEEAVKWAKIQKETLAKKAEGELQATQEIATKLEGIELVIPVKIGEKQQLFESVTEKKIADKLKELGFDVKKDQINLVKPIKELGEYRVKILFEHNLEAEIKIVVSQG